MEIPYTIVYTKRRSVSLMISRQGSVVVRAPKGVLKNFLDGLVKQKADWILKHTGLISKRKLKEKQFFEGELFLLFGKLYPLCILEGFRSRLEFNEGFYLSKFKLTTARKIFLNFYKDKAREVLLEQAVKYAELMGVSFKKLNITSAVTRWGSCSTSGSINFSYKLVMAPIEIIEYVVVHELAHISHKNHSVRFWRNVQDYYPDFAIARKWLRVNGSTLSL